MRKISRSAAAKKGWATRKAGGARTSKSTKGKATMTWSEKRVLSRRKRSRFSRG